MDRLGKDLLELEDAEAHRVVEDHRQDEQVAAVAPFPAEVVAFGEGEPLEELPAELFRRKIGDGEEHEPEDRETDQRRHQPLQMQAVEKDDVGEGADEHRRHGDAREGQEDAEGDDRQGDEQEGAVRRPLVPQVD